LASGLPFDEDTQLLRVVFNTEINPVTGKISSTAFTPSTSHLGLLSTEHGDRPGGAEAYKEAVDLQDIAGIWAVTVAECDADPALNLPALQLIDDGGEDEKSPWHVSIDYRPYVNAAYRVNSPGIRKGKYLRDQAQARGKLA
jgi:hypothetical protein